MRYGCNMNLVYKMLHYIYANSLKTARIKSNCAKKMLAKYCLVWYDETHEY